MIEQTLYSALLHNFQVDLAYVVVGAVIASFIYRVRTP